MFQRFDPKIEVLCRKQYWLFPYFKRCRTQRGNVHPIIAKDTDIVIEGYPRSANSFSVRAFYYAQCSYVKVAHHFHSEAQIALGVKWKIPVLVPIRHALDACTSHAIFSRTEDILPLVKRWISFHENIFLFHEGIVFAPFDNIVTEFGSVIQEVNHKFGTNFLPFVHTSANVDQIRCQDQMYWESKIKDPQQRSRQLTLPSNERKQMKEVIKHQAKSDILLQ